MNNIINVDGILVSDECKIDIGNNVKRVGSKSWMRFEEYMGSKNVGEYLEKGGLKADLRWDVKKGFVKLVEKWDMKSKKVVMLEVKK